MIDSSEAVLAPDLATLRAVDFDWAASLQDVWRDQPYDVPQLHQRTRREFNQRLARLRSESELGHCSSPLGWVVMGAGGCGKTHLLGTMRALTIQQHGFFVLVDMTDVRDFWETTLQGYLDSLHAESPGQTQYQVLLRSLVAQVSSEGYVDHNLRVLRARPGKDLPRDIQRLLGALPSPRREAAMLHQDVLRALACLNSSDLAAASAGLTWLQGQELDAETLRELGYRQARAEPKQIIRSLSWWLSLVGPTVVAFDQLDPIVHQLAPLARVPQQPWQQQTAAAARGIVEQIGGGLSALRDVAINTIVVVSCVESTWALLNEHVLSTYRDRFEPPIRLGRPAEPLVFESLIRNRLAPAMADNQWHAPYPTWPFHEQAIAEISSETPREVLQWCDAHRRACVLAGEVTELRSFADIGRRSEPVVREDAVADLARAFERLRSETAVDPLLDEENEDHVLGGLLRGVLACWIMEQSEASPAREVFELETEFGAGVGGSPPLHARLRCCDPRQPHRERHVSFRALQKSHHAAFLARLKAAISHSGIDPALDFRALVVVRTLPTPGGAATAKLLQCLMDAGGAIHAPSEQELRSWAALGALLKQEPPALPTWLRRQRVVSSLPIGELLSPRRVEPT